MSDPARGDRVARIVVVPLLALLVAIVGVFYGLYTTAQVSGPSMETTLLDQDRVLVMRGYDRAVRGDVVVVSESPAGAERYDVIKRIAAVGGDTVRFDNGVAVVNGTPVPTPGVPSLSNESSAEITIPDGGVFLLGDNRPESLDSRDYGPVRLSQIRGRAVFIFSPLTRLGSVK